MAVPFYPQSHKRTHTHIHARADHVPFVWNGGFWGPDKQLLPTYSLVALVDVGAPNADSQRKEKRKMEKKYAQTYRCFVCTM